VRCLSGDWGSSRSARANIAGAPEGSMVSTGDAGLIVAAGVAYLSLIQTKGEAR